LKIVDFGIGIFLMTGIIACQNGSPAGKAPFVPSNKEGTYPGKSDQSAVTLMVLPKSPAPGQALSILTVGGSDLKKARIIITGPSGTAESIKSRTGDEFPFWRIDDFKGLPQGKYKIGLEWSNKTLANLDFQVTAERPDVKEGDAVWKSLKGWDSGMEQVYSAWINALFKGCDEQASWTALNKVTENPAQNFLYNYLSLGEDDKDGKNSVAMQPDCADNPFYLRAYFAWKLGLPFGFHMCDRGSLERKPKAGQWFTNEMSSSKNNKVAAFNSFLRMVMNGVQSATARTALDDENSDYYPVPLEDNDLRPGTVFADPYGHTLILVGRIPQSKDHPGILLSVDAQPDGTVGIKRFWKGNFLFNTSGVIGEAGFKVFRPIILAGGKPRLMKNKELTRTSGYVPYSLQQRKMETGVFYHTMERIINPKPLDAEAALEDLIQALHEQLLVRVTSVANGEAYFKSHTGAIVPMPSSAAAIFQAGGQWEDFSTPNRDLRLLIAIDAIVEFPDIVSRSPGDFKVSEQSPEQIKKKLQLMLEKKVNELSISYTHTDGSVQKLTLAEILKRKDALEMAYNPNDGIEIRWGAPENSSERASCRRHAPASQLEKMKSVRQWFSKRLHPPT
jgi:hypothetical protein